jgi:hypothetical protein
MAISTAIVHLMCRQMSDKAVADGPAVHPGWATRTLKMHFTEPVTFEFFCFTTTGRSALEVRRSAFGLRRCLLLLRTVRSVYLCFPVFLSEAHLGAVDGPPQGPGRSTHRCFSSKLLLSVIIYGIPDNRFRIVVDEFIHLTNDQLAN